MIILKMRKRDTDVYYKFKGIIAWSGDLEASSASDNFFGKTAAISVLDICKTIHSGSSSLDMSDLSEKDGRYLTFIIEYLFGELKTEYL